MTPTPPSTSSSVGGHSPDTQYRVVRKRNRVPLSCGPCRHRKLKCNRTHPCENCVRRGDASSCSYAAPGTRKKNQSQGATSPDDMQNRIDRLEGLVLSLMTNGGQSAGPTAAHAAISRSQSNSVGSSLPVDAENDDDDMIKEEDEDESEVEGVTNSFGVLKVDSDRGKSLYIGDSHWHLVLADIAEVKNYFTAHKKDIEKNYERIQQSMPSNLTNGPAFLFSSHTTASDVELRSEIPPKSAVEKLVTRYFNSYDPAVHIIHSPTFHKQLQAHWLDPSKTSIVWLGLLYSLMCLAMQSYQKIGDEPPEWKGRSQDLATEYRMRTIQCLVNSDYTKSSIYTIETLILYVNGEYAAGWDAEVGIWVVVGIIVRLAMRMGYHRDPSNYPGVTPYQAEMRRRIWSTVRQMDIMFSFQLALPGMVRDSDSDTALPSNIFEDEFGPDSKQLPPSRPLTEPTPISYMITQAQTTFEFGAILEEINSVKKPVSYDEILKHDTRLRELKANMAPHLRLRPMEECTHDPATLLMQRFNIEIMWQKSVVVLHRKYIGRVRQNPRYAHSRRACVDSSMEILRHQAKLHHESQPGGRMRTMKWFISSLTKHDYLLGAMIVCLDLHYDFTSEAMPEKPPHYDPNFWTTAQRAEMFRALENSLLLWKEGAESSMEAYKASNVLEIMLQKLRRSQNPAPQQPSSSEFLQGPTTAEVFAQFDEQKPEHSAAMTLGMLSGGLTPNTAAFLNSMAPSPGGGRYGNVDMNMGDPSSSNSGGTGMTPNFAMDTPNVFGNMGSNNPASPFAMFGGAGAGVGGGLLDAPVNLDWEAWDQYIQSGNMVDPNFSFYNTSLDPNLDQSTQQQPQQDQNQGQNQGYGNSVFMGASENTPGR